MWWAWASELVVGVWWGTEAAVGCAGLGLAGLLVGAGGWALGSLWAEPPTAAAAAAGLPCGPELAGLAEALWWAAPGKRLDVLRRLADYAQALKERHARERSGAVGFVFGGGLPGPWVGGLMRDYPVDLVWALVGCLEERPSEAAPLVLGLFGGKLLPPLPTRPPSGVWVRGWERFFCEASFVRLRSLLLASEDPAVAKALLCLYSYASQRLRDFQYYGAWATSSEAWAAVGRASLGRQQAFLRDPAVLGKLRGLLCGGDPHHILVPAIWVYKGMVGGLWNPTIGLFHLLWPILDDIALNFHKLDVGGFGVQPTMIFSLSPQERAEEAVEVVERFLLPWLARDEELTPACLHWLAYAFPSEWWTCPLGLRLRSRTIDALTGVLRRGRLSPAQTWAFISGALGHLVGIRVVETELGGFAARAWGRLPIPPESFDAALRVTQHFIRDNIGKEESRLAVRSGGFLVLARLLGQLRQRLPPTLAWLLRCAVRLLGCPDFVLSGGEAAERLILWRDSGLDAALRDLLAQEPLPHGHAEAQALLDTATSLLHTQPLPQYSRAPLHIPFPIR